MFRVPRWSPLALLICLFATGCGGAGAKLVGKWKVDTTGLGDAMGGQDNPAGAMAAAMAGAMAGALQMEMEFKSNGTATVSIMGQSASATWSVIESQGDMLTLKVKPANQSEQTSTVRFLDADTIEVTDSGPAMRLKRVK